MKGLEIQDLNKTVQPPDLAFDVINRRVNARALPKAREIGDDQFIGRTESLWEKTPLMLFRTKAMDKKDGLPLPALEENPPVIIHLDFFPVQSCLPPDIPLNCFHEQVRSPQFGGSVPHPLGGSIPVRTSLSQNVQNPLELSPLEADGSFRADLHAAVASNASIIVVEGNAGILRGFDGATRTNRLTLIAESAFLRPTALVFL